MRMACGMKAHVMEAERDDALSEGRPFNTKCRAYVFFLVLILMCRGTALSRGATNGFIMMMNCNE